jgi:hypothetical protein
MTVETQQNKVQYMGNGWATEFPLNFPLLRPEHLRLFLWANNRQSELTEGFTVLGAGTKAATVRLAEAPAPGAVLTILRQVPLAQPMALSNSGPFNADTLEGCADNLEMQIQQLAEMAGRAVVMPAGLPDAERAGRTNYEILLDLVAAAEAAGVQAQEDAGRAAAYAALARGWAAGPEDDPVADGLFSALHYAAKAENAAGRLGAIPATTEKLGGVIIGDGLTVEASGRTSVDFSGMPTDKFEALLASLRIQIFLAADTAWYVDAAGGSDSYVVQDIGTKGRTAATAFRTPQAAIDFVTVNFNVGEFVATIRVVSAGGLSCQALTLKRYTATSGRMELEAAAKQTLEAYIRTSENAGTWHIGNFIMKCPGAPDGAEGWFRHISVGQGARVDFCDCDFDTSAADTAIAAGIRVFDINGGVVYLWGDRPFSTAENAKRPVEFTEHFDGVFYLCGGGQFVLRANVKFSMVALRASSAFVSCFLAGMWRRMVLASGLPAPAISGTITGAFRKFDVYLNGMVDTGGGGDAWLPWGTAYAPRSGGQIA